MHRELGVHRPSAAMAVAVIALFVALGGVGWAQLSVPRGSVGTAQLRSNAVTGSKIANGSVGTFKLKLGAVGSKRLMNNAVGIEQINANQVQARVIGTCRGAGAIATIATTGNVTCTTTPPQEFGANLPATAVRLGSGSTAIVTRSLPAASPYLVFADPHVAITSSPSSAQVVTVDCTLAVTPSGSATAAASVTSASTTYVPGPSGAGSTTPQLGQTIALTLPSPSAVNESTAAVSCTGSAVDAASATTTAPPTVTVSSNINAIQVANNNT